MAVLGSLSCGSPPFVGNCGRITEDEKAHAADRNESFNNGESMIIMIRKAVFSKQDGSFYRGEKGRYSTCMVLVFTFHHLSQKKKKEKRVEMRSVRFR